MGLTITAYSKLQLTKKRNTNSENTVQIIKLQDWPERHLPFKDNRVYEFSEEFKIIDVGYAGYMRFRNQLAKFSGYVNIFETFVLTEEEEKTVVEDVKSSIPSHIKYDKLPETMLEWQRRTAICKKYNLDQEGYSTCQYFPYFMDASNKNNGLFNIILSFADNGGSIGYIDCIKLLKDFEDNYEKAKLFVTTHTFNDYSFIQLYEKFIEGLKLAAQEGVIDLE